MKIDSATAPWSASMVEHNVDAFHARPRRFLVEQVRVTSSKCPAAISSSTYFLRPLLRLSTTLTPPPRVACRMSNLLDRMLFNVVIAENEKIHPCSDERLHSLLGCAADRLVFVEAGVQQDRHARPFSEGSD